MTSNKPYEKLLERLPVYSLPNLCHLYRVRENTGFDKTDITQFGYNHNTDQIERSRLNKKGEPVLYTSTHPVVAAMETNISRDFYMVKYKNREGLKLSSFIAVDDNCSMLENSTSRKMRNAIVSHFSEEELYVTDQLRKILETPYNADDVDKYKESSELASKIFEVVDTIVTYSRAGGDCIKDLNYTFNRLAADRYAEIETIYHCEMPQNVARMEHVVTEVGLPDKDGNVIRWYDNLTVDEDSLRIHHFQGDVLGVKDVLKKYGKKLMPNVNISLFDEEHIAKINLINGNYDVRFYFQPLT